MAKRYGAAVIALTIDEQGMALTADKKVAVAKRIFELATEKYGIRPVDLIFDASTLPISTGQEDYRTAGIETLEGGAADQGRAARGEDHPRRQQHFVRPERLLAAGAELCFHA